VSYIVLRGHWSIIIVPNAHAPTEEKNIYTKDSFYEELEQVFNNFPEYHVKILLGDFNAKLGKEDIFNLIIGNESLQVDSNDNDIFLNETRSVFTHLFVFPQFLFTETVHVSAVVSHHQA
jgi:exonuclease III